MGLAIVARDTVPGTHRRVDIREAVAELHRRHPRAGANRLAEMLVEQMEEDRPLLLDAGRFLVERILAAAETRQRQSRAAPAPEQRTARKAYERAQVQAIAVRAREIVLLDMQIPLLDGSQKALRFCYGHELASLGDAYSRIAAKVGPTNMTGEILTEREVREILDSNQI